MSLFKTYTQQKFVQETSYTPQHLLAASKSEDSDNVIDNFQYSESEPGLIEAKKAEYHNKTEELYTKKFEEDCKNLRTHHHSRQYFKELAGLKYSGFVGSQYTGWSNESLQKVKLEVLENVRDAHRFRNARVVRNPNKKKNRNKKKDRNKVHIYPDWLRSRCMKAILTKSDNDNSSIWAQIANLGMDTMLKIANFPAGVLKMFLKYCKIIFSMDFAFAKCRDGFTETINYLTAPNSPWKDDAIGGPLVAKLVMFKDQLNDKYGKQRLLNAEGSFYEATGRVGQGFKFTVICILITVIVLILTGAVLDGAVGFTTIIASTGTEGIVPALVHMGNATFTGVWSVTKLLYHVHTMWP